MQNVNPFSTQPPVGHLQTPPLSYFKDHLVVSRSRGDEYQISYFIYFCFHHLFKERGLQATYEAKGYGNLDDIQIHLSEKVKAYQVKFFKPHISLDDFWNGEKHEGKNANMHVGKFFDGWLSLRENNKTKTIIPYLLTNTELDDNYPGSLELSKNKKQLKFLESFITGEKKISFIWHEIVPIEKVTKSFLQKENVASNALSGKVWEVLNKKGFFDNEKFPTKMLLDCINRGDYGFDHKSFKTLKGRAQGSLTLDDVARKLRSIKEQYEQHLQSSKNAGEDIGLFEHLFRQACHYLESKKSHLPFLQKDERTRKEEFKNFLRAFRFNVNRENLEELQGRIQNLLKDKYRGCSHLLYPHVKFEIGSWFHNPRTFVAKRGEETPIIDNNYLWRILEKADVNRQAIDKLFEYGASQFDKIDISICGEQIRRESLLVRIDQAITSKQLVLVMGPKGIGKSALIKTYLEQQSCPWFAFAGKDLSSYNSLHKFLGKHKLSLNKEILKRFSETEKKILYIDSMEEVSRKNGAFLELINLFRKENWTVVISSNSNSKKWFEENVVSLSYKQIEVLKIPLLGAEQQVESDNTLTQLHNDPLESIFNKYPLLNHIRRRKLFQPPYNNLFRNVSLRMLCVT